MHLNFLTAIFYSIVVHFLSVPVGYLLLHYKLKNNFSEIPFFVRYPLYVSIGLSLLGIISYFTVPFFVNGLVLLIISMICWFIIFYRLSNREIIITSFINLNELLPLTLFLILFLHFSFIIGYFKWPPVGDLLSHGRTVSYLISHQITNLEIYFLYYPFSFHALSADLSLLLGTYPGETVFLVGGIIVTLIPMVLYSLTFVITKSKGASLIPFIGSLIYHKEHLVYWFIGYFYNGPYPCMWGFLVFFTFFTICCLERYFPSKKHHLTILFILTLHTYTVYSPFILFNALFLFSIFLKYKTIVTRVIRQITIKQLIILLLLLSASLYSVAILFSKFVELQNLEQVAAIYGLQTPILTSMSGYTINFYIVIFGIPLILYLWIKKRYSDIPLLYIIPLSASILLTLHSIFHSFLYFLLPQRSFMIAAGLSWLVLALFIHSFLNTKSKILISLLFNNRRYFINPKPFISLSLIAIMVFSLPIYSPFPINSVKSFGWFILSDNPTDLEALEWMHKNVPSEAIILGDASFASQFLHSFSAKGPWNSLYLVREYVELRSIWRNPENKTLVIHLLRKYNISYIFVSSEQGWWEEHGYGSKPRAPKQYIEIFDNYNFLQKVFEKGNSAIYKVMLNGEEFKRN